MLDHLLDLTGRVAVVTGGSRGLGLQIAAALGEFGARPVLVARRPAELAEAASRLADEGVEADTVAADLGSAAGVAALEDALRGRFERVDILVNNAGATWGAAAEDHPVAAWDKVMGLNVTGMFLVTQMIARDYMLPAGRGSIVNVASIEGLQGHHARQLGTVAYNAAKGAVVNMTRALAAEWGGRGVRVNALAPGYFPSRMTRGVLDALTDAIVEQTPLGKLGGADDLKGPALLLASDAGGHMTGHVLVVDGGMTVI